MKQTLKNIYNQLLKSYGCQGWWPFLELHNSGINPTKTGSINGYHPNDFSFPKNKQQQFEIILGTILTQNTSWPQVEKSLLNLQALNCLTPEKIISIEDEKIKQAIKPSGYFNQKSQRIKSIAKWFSELNQIPTRQELLSLNGIGPETADSILLYAFSQPEFIIDNYTKRILTNLKIIKGTEKYQEIKNLFEQNLEKDFKIFQEFHALLVEHAKNFYIKKENYSKDFLLNRHNNIFK